LAGGEGGELAGSEGALLEWENKRGGGGEQEGWRGRIRGVEGENKRGGTRVFTKFRILEISYISYVFF
jgi:hypothetical protein